MRILGIDTAIRCTGYGIVDFNGSNIQIIDCGIIKNPSSIPHSECLRRIGGGIRELVTKFKPDSAALESAFYAKNIKTSMILSYAKGAILLVLAENSIPAYEYAPRKAKMAIGGRGSSSKEAIAKIIASMLELDISQIPLDSTDALAIAICHGQIATKSGAKEFLNKKI